MKRVNALHRDRLTELYHHWSATKMIRRDVLRDFDHRLAVIGGEIERLERLLSGQTTLDEDFPAEGDPN